jgi:predicted alpha/beta superfamily hydrolase
LLSNSLLIPKYPKFMKQTLAMLLFCTVIFAQKPTQKISSAALGTSRTITVVLPESYEKSPTRKYPLLVLLDGDYLLDPFSGALQYGAYWDDMPETIIVGIQQNRKNERVDDCSYDENTDLPDIKSAKFFEFIGAELLPDLEQKYRLAPFKIIAGHDLTAGFMNYFLYKGIPLFNAFISLSPELAPNMEIKVPERLATMKTPIFYYQCSSDDDIKEIQDPIKLLDQNIKTLSNPLLIYKYDVFKKTTHYSQILYAIPSALNLIFDTYKPITPAEYKEKILPLKTDYTEYLSKKYEYINKGLGIQMPVRLNDFKAIEAAILKNKSYEELEKLATFAAENFPKSLISDFEMGMMYQFIGDPKRAAKKYQDALQGKEIGDWTKALVQEKYEDVKSLIIKK